MSDSSARRVVRMFIEAVNQCDQLKISLPTHNELEEVAMGFTAVSSADNAFHGVVGAIDGFLCSRIQPNTIEVSNPADYFSYHYQMYGVNVQAVCDSNLRFRYVGVAGPGKMDDNRAVRRCESLLAWVDALPEQYCIVGDGAYSLSNKILIPFKLCYSTQTRSRYSIITTDSCKELGTYVSLASVNTSFCSHSIHNEPCCCCHKLSSGQISSSRKHHQ